MCRYIFVLQSINDFKNGTIRQRLSYKDIGLTKMDPVKIIYPFSLN